MQNITFPSTDTKYLKWALPDCMKKTVFHICYNRVGQKVSICDYWNGENKGGGVFSGLHYPC